MGTFAGHFIPGAEFMLLALFLNLIYKAEQLAGRHAADVECNYASVGPDGDKEPARSAAAAASEGGHRTAKIKLAFSLYTIISISLGVLYEGLGGIVMAKEGGFFAEKGHLSMYLGFLPAGIAFGFESGLLPGAQRRHVDNAPLYSQAAFALGFFNQYIQLSAHATMKEMGADTTFHVLWALAAGLVALSYAVSVVAQLAGTARLARAAQLMCPAALNLQGSWIIFTGWTLFGGEFRVMRNNDLPMEDIYAYFSFFTLVWSVTQYLWIEVMPVGFARCYQGAVA